MAQGSAVGTASLICRAVLIDNDGVLVDSASSIKRAFARWAEAFGLDGEKVYQELHGHRAHDVAEAVLAPELVDEGARMLDQYEIEDAVNVRAIEGVRGFLEQLDGNWTLVSSGPRALVEARLAAAGLPFPQHMVSANDVSNGKPHPESYQLAAQLNGLAADECVAFEDSTTGLCAALAAGCVTVQVGSSAPRLPSVPMVSSLGDVEAVTLQDGFNLILREAR